ncbi:L-type lectin-domain containing receptor kinase IX.2-like [Bidens hawaiensis]|uniref:L-type lectin-domain containing receptor kinase IX.2-like n=1 Tax=Bidens hawaiensis TaxID=980011 RepID=UPI00404A6C1A
MKNGALAKGGFGKVYKGKISDEPTDVFAIKRLHLESHQGAPEFWVEVELLSRLRHCNLVSLVGYCNKGKEMALVYEYMPNGTLYDHLHKKGTVLTWSQWLKICIGAARGLDYLHTGTGTQQGVIHRDVKSSNILLDQNYAAKIADFGLAIIGPTNQTRTYVSTVVKGTFGYMDPNYFYTGRLTRKSDVFAFGVVLLEVLSGRRALDESLEEGLAIWAQDLIKKGKLDQIISPSLRDHISKSSLKEFSGIAVRCLLGHPNQRPTMSEVVGSLSRALSFQERKASSTQEGIKIKKLWSFLSPKGHSEAGSSRQDPNRFPLGGIAAFPSIDDDFDSRTGPRRYLLRDLIVATNNFSDANKLGQGGFGCVYKGYLSREDILVAVKKISQDSNQGKKEYMTEVKVISSLRHRNLVKIIGWCHDEAQFLLVYELIPNGSLDNYLFFKKCILTWDLRYIIAKGLASALLYLHEECEQYVIHRDIKASNIMLDSGFNAKLGDFGLARLVDHGLSLQSSMLAGTLGYMAPECVLTGKASKESDVYSFGVVALEIACGKKAIHTADDEYFRLIEWVWGLYERSELLSGVDPMLNNEFNTKEVECLMMVGLWCSHPDRGLRPSIHQAIQVLKFEGALSNLPTKMPVANYYKPTPYSFDVDSPGTTMSDISIDLIR